MARILLSLIVSLTLCISVPVFASDGVVLINQSKVNAAGGFPFKITHSGSYKLSGNLTVPANTDAIELLVDDVTIDLNGFTIKGPIVCDNGTGANCAPAASGTPAGVSAPTAVGVDIRNGHIRGFVFGIQLLGGLVEDMEFVSNIDGIAGNDTVIRRTTARNSGNVGIICDGCVVTESIARDNFGSGFFLTGGGVFGSNRLTSSPGRTFVLDPSITSQHNSSCDGGVC
jgi:hypothetical protein